MVNVGKNVFYKDIYAFIDRLKDMAPIKGEDKLRTVIPQCLRGTALIWHSTELSDVQKETYRYTTLQGWYLLLISRFKERTPLALAKLQTAHYTMTDAKDRKDPRVFVQNIIRYAKAANLTTVHNQLAMAWNNLDWEFRLHIPEPTEATTIELFLSHLDAKADMWYDMARHRGYSKDKDKDKKHSHTSTNKHDKRKQGNSSSNGNDAISGLLNLLAGQANHPYYKNRAYSNNQNQIFESPKVPAQLQITAGKSSDSKKSPKSYSDKAFSKDKSKAKSKPHAYVAEEDAQDIEYYDPDRDFEDEEDDESSASSSESSEEATANLILPAIPRSFRCRTCKGTFDSNNKLHRHIRGGCQTLFHTSMKTEYLSQDAYASTKASPASTNASTKATSPSPTFTKALLGTIVNSRVDPNKDIGTGCGFRGWKYATADVSLCSESCEIPSPEKGCLDTGAGITICDEIFFKRQTQGKVPIRTMATPITVRGIGTDKHPTDQYAIVSLNLPGKDRQGKSAIARFRREIHLVKDLKANILLGTDILGPEQFSIDLGRKEATIGSCDVIIPINIGSRSTTPAVQRSVHLRKTTTVPPHSVMPVPIHRLGDVPKDRDYMFEPDDVNFSLYAHLVDSDTSSILVRNNTGKSLHIPRNFRLGRVMELDYPNACHVSGEDAEDLAIRRPKKEHKNSWLKKLLVACTATAAATTGILSPTANLASISPKVAPIRSEVTPISSEVGSISSGISPISLPAPSPEVIMPNGVTIHNSSKEAVDAFSKLVNEFPTIWHDTGFATLPEENWMKIPLRSDWEDKISGKAKIYPLGAKDREVVDQTFDELQALGRLSYTTDSTPFSYPCFVVWKVMADGSKKGRVVVDIRGLNAITVPDAYPLPLQSEIIVAVRDCQYISVIDCTAFFYQWRVFFKDRHKLTVVSHRGQESFNVAPMGYKNSPAYVQRQIDRILRPYRGFARAYVDDIVIFSKTLEDHIRHLRQIFTTLGQNNISVKPSKAFLGYPTVQLLGQKVDSLGLATTDEKLAAIAKLDFPNTLRQLEHYLGLTGWLREYVERYAKISEPLQNRKTALLKDAPPSGNARRVYSAKTRFINPTPEELKSYEDLQLALGKRQKLTHFNPKRVLYMDVDSSKESGIGGILYHVRTDCEGYPTRPNIEPITFLSRLLVSAETRYWPTELELAGLVWMLRKTRHMVEASQHTTIVYTDHGAALGIAKQVTLSTTSTDKLNLRLVRASDYVQRFRLDIRHKPGKLHIVPDALSRLATSNQDPTMSEEGELDVLFTTSMVSLHDDFRKVISNGYENDPIWAKILKTLTKNGTEDGAELPFVVEDGLIFRLEGYYSGDHAFQPRRLCIPPGGAQKEIFEAIHDRNNHLGFARCYERIINSYYIRNLSKRLHEYVRHCPQCQSLQTRRHKPYGSLQPILTPPIPFHTLTIDFMLAFPKTLSGLDCMMSVTCKFSKRATVIPGAINWDAMQWAAALLERLDISDWGLPKVIISDRDRKFLSDLWTSLFQRLGVKSLYSTAYHPQTDGQSERTNQTLEIAFRFLMCSLDDPKDWPKLGGPIQRAYNNSISATTGKSPNEIVYGFTPVQSTDFAKASTEAILSPKLVRMEAADALAFAQINSKSTYDAKHKPLSLKVGDFALLKLHKGYNIPSAALLGRKIGQQYAGPFKILEKIGQLAYRLKLPSHWQIHPVVTVAQLEPCPDPASDPFERPRPSRNEPVYVDGDTDKVKSYEVDRIITHRPTQRRGIEYLIRWKGYGPEEDVWRNTQELGDAPDLLKDYERAHPEAFPTGQEIVPYTGSTKTAIPPKRARGRPRKKKP